MKMERIFGDSLGDWRRSCYCGELRPVSVGQELTLMGWVQRRRDHGGLIFIDLRDRTGIVQAVFNPAINAPAHEKAKQVRAEDVIAVRGLVARRPAETVNPQLATGEVELVVSDVKLLSASEPPPFTVEDETEANENTRLKYRYLDIRRPQRFAALNLRYRMVKLIRDYLDQQGFLEVETPLLTKSTPEGARDYLVPSRIYPGKFYALPQSPQLFKQILMVGGVDRYFQIARCFRDEDLRADRQPEFTQIDLEMSFVTAAEVMAVVEPMIADLFTWVRGHEVPRPFPVMSYADAMLRYGTDRPDLRVELELADFSECFAGTSFRVFADALGQGRRVRGLVAQGGGAALSRRELDDLVAFAVGEGAGGLTWIRIGADGWQSPAVKFLGDAERERLTAAGRLENGDLLILLAEPEARAAAILGQLRLRLGERLGRVVADADRFLWVVDFPLLDREPDSERY